MISRTDGSPSSTTICPISGNEPMDSALSIRALPNARARSGLSRRCCTSLRLGAPGGKNYRPANVSTSLRASSTGIPSRRRVCSLPALIPARSSISRAISSSEVSSGSLERRSITISLLLIASMSQSPAQMTNAQKGSASTRSPNKHNFRCGKNGRQARSLRSITPHQNLTTKEVLPSQSPC
jgi:hypothetical protein